MLATVVRKKDKPISIQLCQEFPKLESKNHGNSNRKCCQDVSKLIEKKWKTGEQTVIILAQYHSGLQKTG